VVVADVHDVGLQRGRDQLALGRECGVALQVALVLLLIDVDVGRILRDARLDLPLQTAPEALLDRQQLSPGVDIGRLVRGVPLEARAELTRCSQTRFGSPGTRSGHEDDRTPG